MTALLERVAKVMGWDIKYGHFRVIKNGCFPQSIYAISDMGTNTPTGHWLSHLLVEKMVGDGWNFEFYNWKEGGTDFPERYYFSVNVSNENTQTIHCADADTAPAAILALFVKVYGL